MSRNSYLMQSVSKTDKLIEIGPSLNPMAPKADQWRSFSIDHADQAGLREKYKNDPSVDPLKIERVDFVWTQGSLSDAVPPEHLHTFDLFLASHVIEHFPNVVDFLASADTLTHAKGRVILVVPDKRMCFDMFRSLSSTGEAIAAHLEKRVRHSTANVFDFMSKAVQKNGLPGWVMGNQTPTKPMVFDIETAHHHAIAAGQEVYIDAHAWIFCPASFQLIMIELARLGYTDWQVDRCEATQETEFYAWLSKGGKAHYQAMEAQTFYDLRLGLMNQTILELSEQRKTIANEADRAVAAASLEALQHVAAENAKNQTALTAQVDHLHAEAQRLQTEIDRIYASKWLRLRRGIKKYLFV